MAVRLPFLTGVALLVSSIAVVSPGDATSGPVSEPARAAERADRRPNQLVEYEVFGDSIVTGLGLAPHLTWVAATAYHLAVTEGPGVEHRFRNHAVDGQSIVTPSPLAVDPTRSTLLDSIRAFLAAPDGSAPVVERWFVLTPSVNELIISDRGPSSVDRVENAVDGMERAVTLLRAAGVPAERVIVLPMPPIGLEFAAAYDPESGIDAPLASMIAATNRELADVLTIDRYPRLDPEDDGLADVSVFDGWRGPSGMRDFDGLHLDAEGHALLATEIEPLFGT